MWDGPGTLAHARYNGWRNIDPAGGGAVPKGGVGHRVLSWTRVVFVATALCALVLGFVGTKAFAEARPGTMLGTGFWDTVYYDLQLFVLGAQPLELPGPYPLALNIARFAAPAATIYALFEAARAVFAGQVRRWWIRTRTGNLIIVGATPAATTLKTRLASSGRSRQRRRVVAVDTADAQAMQAAGVARASVVYAFADDGGDSTLNVATALAAARVRRLRPRRGKLRVYAHVSNATLALALRARRLGLSKNDGLQVDFINLDELAARGLLTAADVIVESGRSPHILVAGLGTFGRALIVEYARQWRLASPRRTERVAVTLVDAEASRVAAELAACWDIVRGVLDLTPVDGTLEAALRAVPDGPAPHRAYLCYDDEEMALTAALTTVELWHGGRHSVVVRLNRLSRHGEAFQASGLLDDVAGRLRLIGVTNIACDPAVIGQDLVERLAEAIHERYLLELLQGGVALYAADRPAMRPWSELPEQLRHANRAQAAGIGSMLAMVGCAAAPRNGVDGPITFLPEEVEALAMHEQERWCAERRAAGIKVGPRRDARHNPDLVSWDQLPEKSREITRDAIRHLPEILADVGLQIVRLNPLVHSNQPVTV